MTYGENQQRQRKEKQMSNCPVFKDTDEDLDDKIKKCDRRGSGYAIEITDVKVYLEHIKRQDSEGDNK